MRIERPGGNRAPLRDILFLMIGGGRVSRLILGSLLILALFAGACGGTGADGEAFDRAGLERHEDLSEALANDLLKLSIAVRDRDYGKIENFVAPAITVIVSARICPPATTRFRGS